MFGVVNKSIGIGASACTLVLVLKALGIKNGFKAATFIAGFKYLIESDIDSFGVAAVTGMLWGASSWLDYHHEDQ
jgi:hypothetical protein